MSRLYVYAVLRAGDARTVDLPAVAEPGATIRCLSTGRVCAVVSEISVEEVMSTRRNMLSHTKVLEELIRDRPVLPFRFGVIAAGSEKLSAILRSREAELLSALDDLSDAIEVGVRVSFVEAEIFRDIVAETPELRLKSETLLRRPPAETYYARIELGRQVGQRMAARRVAIASMLADRLARHARKCVVHPVNDDMLVFHASYLVARSGEPSLFAEIERLEAESGGRLIIRYVAPAPPYNFVSLKLDTLPLAA